MASLYDPPRGWELKPAIRLFSVSMERQRTTHIPPKIFSYFFFSQSLFISEGILAYFPLQAWWAPITWANHQASRTAEGRRAVREGRTHCMELMLRVCLGAAKQCRARIG